MIKLFDYSQILNKDETLPVARKQAAHYVDGKPVYAPNLEFFIITNVQPVSGRDLLLVPEHDRFTEQYWLYFKNDQWFVNQGLEYHGPSYLMINDIITRKDQANPNTVANYQVQTIENWGSYCRARMMRVDVGPQKTP